ncbi:tannase and feruloyl esterase [Pseudomassariella vexata]|uniref:Carboxylic ester hydrolase n=1 Tax=Pseudomassariella vexata TaxID=1141098 RepID=A0A1Y2DL95_9PEZI|nr:tannase and feruloyl esterase [Pseudomassariella vexata]ORY60088.1 tannase and feruloyl esterase [Pseudomassariella vexata]
MSHLWKSIIRHKRSVMFEVWLPDVADYTGRFVVVFELHAHIAPRERGLQSEMIDKVNSGYAVAGGDSGHRASENNDGAGEPGVRISYMHDADQVNTWIHKSIAYFTPAARSLIEAFYRQKTKRSYYISCSTGGAQGFALAQFHPELFDGIVAGCPGNWYSHLALSFLWNSQQTQGLSFLPQETLDLITRTALSECDTLDGVEDGVIENPLICDFDIASLECSSSTNSPTCLTQAQIAAAKKIYAGPRSATTNTSLYPGFSVGSEIEWMYQEATLADAFAVPILQNMVFDNLTYDADTFNWGTDVDALDEKVGTYIDEISPDLSAFKAAGGKMLVLQSWADPYNAATWPIQHLGQLEQFFAGDVGDWFRLFMVPGGRHCGAATNYPQVPAKWHSLESLVQWIETAEVPTEMLSSDPTNESLSKKTRKLCPWPKTAKYLGGDSNDWTSFECGV